MSTMANSVSHGSCTFYERASNKINGSERDPYTFNRRCARLCMKSREIFVGVLVFK